MSGFDGVCMMYAERWMMMDVRMKRRFADEVGKGNGVWLYDDD